MAKQKPRKPTPKLAPKTTARSIPKSRKRVKTPLNKPPRIGIGQDSELQRRVASRKALSRRSQELGAKSKRPGTAGKLDRVKGQIKDIKRHSEHSKSMTAIKNAKKRMANSKKKR